MASTNKTTNYELSQFLGTDKPAWLSDYNSDMSKIDTQMKANADAATAAGGSADAATTAIGTLGNLTTDDKTNLVGAINEVDANANTAQSTANSANTTASSCRTDLNKFNLTNRSVLSPVANVGTLSSITNVQFATDTTNSIFKVYGRILIQNLNGISGEVTLKLGTTSLRPSESYLINSGATIYVYNTNNMYDAIGARNLKIDTDGSIYVIGIEGDYLTRIAGGTAKLDIIIPPCLYFNSNFGDL